MQEEFKLSLLGLEEQDLVAGTSIYKSNCPVCCRSFGYLLIEPAVEGDIGRRVKAENVYITIPDLQPPKPLDEIRCLLCRIKVSHAHDLFPELVYKKD